MQAAARHDVYFPPQLFFQEDMEARQLKKVEIRLTIYEDIDVAVVSQFVASGGAEEIKSGRAERTNFHGAVANPFDNFIPGHAASIAQAPNRTA